MQDFETLIAEHDELDMLAESMARIVITRDCATEALAARAVLSIALDDHLRSEDGFLYDPLISSSPRDYPNAVNTFHQSFADLAGDWSEYLRSWDAACIEADRDAFNRETIAMMARLRARIAEENRLLYPLALQRGHIRLRAAA